MCWSGLPITKRNSCLNLLKSTTNQCHNAIYFLEKEKTSGNTLELQRRGVNKLSGICSRTYQFLQDSVRWGLWQLGAQAGWWMALLTCREVGSRCDTWINSWSLLPSSGWVHTFPVFIDTTPLCHFDTIWHDLFWAFPQNDEVGATLSYQTNWSHLKKFSANIQTKLNVVIFLKWLLYK